MLSFHWKSAYLEPEDLSKTTPRPRHGLGNQNVDFFPKHVDFSLEKCVFGTTTGVLHYALRREFAVFAKQIDFSLEKFVNERGGRAAPCMGSVPVAGMIASEARRPKAGRARQ